jgi:tryptophanyl-tRNA synthetase
VVNALGPIRDKANDLMSDQAELDRLLASGADKARAVAEATLATVYDHVGFIKSH